MRAEVRERWVKDLLSGQYGQTRGRLRDADGCMCAQGVLLHGSGLGQWREYEQGRFEYVIGQGLHDGAVLEALEAPGFDSWAGLERGDLEHMSQVLKLNDNLHASFEDIACYIEANL